MADWSARRGSGPVMLAMERRFKAAILASPEQLLRGSISAPLEIGKFQREHS